MFHYILPYTPVLILMAVFRVLLVASGRQSPGLSRRAHCFWPADRVFPVTPCEACCSSLLAGSERPGAPRSGLLSRLVPAVAWHLKS